MKPVSFLSGLLGSFVAWSLFAGALARPLPLAAGAAAGLWLSLGHTHESVSRTERLARTSAFFDVHPALKVWGSCALLFLCLLAATPWPPLVLFAVMSVLICERGRRWHDYRAALTVPALFLAAGALALLWEYSSVPEGSAMIPFFGGWLVLRPAAQCTARLVMARALGALGCLYFIRFTTPVSELLQVLRTALIPETVIDLAVLMYLYIFLLLETHAAMRDAAASRLGFGSFRRDLRTTGILYGNLLAHSFRRAQASFDAMESRCAGGKLLFLTREKPLRAVHLAGFGVLLVGMTAALVCGG